MQVRYTIHNDKFIFGEILDSPTKLSFANFGPIIETFEQIVQIGASKKREKKNQGGQHGEGLKRAVVRLLNAGCEKVEVYFAMTENDFTDFRHMTFSIGRDKCLCYSMASHNLKERFAGANDYHRFEVVFKKPDNFPDFNIDEYMITDGIRGARDENDPGMVLPMEESGNIYIWHFLVVKYE